MDKECTRHYWCSLRQFSQGGEVDPSLSDLDLLLLAFLWWVATWVGLLLLLALGAVFDKVPVTSALETSIATPQAERWLHILPRALLLLWWRKSRSSLLWGPGYPTSRLGWCSLRCCGRNHTEPLWLPTRNGSRSLPLFLGSVSQDSILLRDSQIDQFAVGGGPHG